MSDTRVRVVFEGSALGAEKASSTVERGIVKIGTAAKVSQDNVDELRKAIEALALAVAGPEKAAKAVDEIGDKAKSSERKVKGLRDSLLGLGAVRVLGVGAGFAALGAGATALAGGAVAATAALVPLVGLVAAAPTGMLAMGLAFGTVKLATQDLSKAFAGNKKALAELTPAAREFVKTVQSYGPLVDKLKATAQAGLFPGLLAGLKDAATPAAFAALNNAIGEMAVALGNVARQFGQLLGSSGFLRSFATVAQNASGWIQTLGGNLVTLFGMFVKVGAAASPLVNWLGQVSTQLIGHAKAMLDASVASGSFNSFLLDTRFALQQFGQLLKNVGQVIIDVFGGGFTVGKQFITALNEGLARLHAFFQSAAGQTQLSDFFYSVRSALAAVLPVLGTLAAEILKTLPSAMRALAGIFASLGPAIVAVLHMVGAALRDVFGQIAKWSSVLAQAIAAIAAFNKPLSESTQQLHRHGESVAQARVPLSHFAQDLRAAGIVAGHLGSALEGLAKGAFVILVDAIKGAITIARRMHDADQEVGEAVKGTFRALASAVSVSVKTIVSVVKDLIGWLKAIPTSIGIHISVPGVGAVVGAAKAIGGFLGGGGGGAGPGGHTGAVPHRAAGGFIPGATGQPVPVLAHAGEIILNPQQQQVLGGPRFLSQLFGFTGDEGPGFAGGGIVGKTKKPTPHHKRGPRPSGKLTAAAEAALASVKTIEQLEIDKDTYYGQRERQLGIEHGYTLGDSGLYQTIGVPLTYDHDGFVTNGAGDTTAVKKGDIVVNDFGEQVMQDIQVLNREALAQRLADIDELVGVRQEYLSLLDQEFLKLQDAIAKMNAAIAELQKEIAAEITAAQTEEARVNELTKAVRAKRDEAHADRVKAHKLRNRASDERAKKKPDKKLIASLEHDARDLDAEATTLSTDATVLDRQIAPHRSAATKHRSQARTLTGTLNQLTGERDSTVILHDHTLLADIRGAGLDIEALQTGRGALTGLAGESGRGYQTPGAFAPIPAGGAGGGFVAAPGVAAAGVDQSALIAWLMEQLGRARLALGVEAVQLPVIGAFQTGTLNVPQTGLALVHAGETITPAGIPRGGNAAAAQSTHHFVELDLGEPLNDLVKSQVLQLGPELSLAIGKESDQRRRGGRY